jgi:D-alanine-D-alanine ligase
MIRIGFAYNQKPPVAAAPEGGATSNVAAVQSEAALGDEEPPSRDSATQDGERSSRATSAVGVATDHERHTRAASAAGHAVADGPRTGAASAALQEIDDEFAEWDAPETIDAVARALSAYGEVVRLEATEDFPERLRRERPAIVFNIAEGLRGVNREAHVPAICEFYGVPYSGSDPFTLSLCLDKARTKETLAFHGIPTAPFALVRDDADAEGLLGRLTSADAPLAFPLFAKPVHEGSSKGITTANYCADVDALRAQLAHLLATYAQPVLVEEFLPGQEFTCAVLGNESGARVLPIVGINFDSLPDGAVPVYGYEAKWVWDRPENPLEIFSCPAPIPEALRERVERVTLDAYRVLGCRDWSRIDVRLDARGVPNVVEVNPLPGILPDPAGNSCFPKAARAAGVDYDGLIQACLLAAAERQGVTLGARR